jgi:hypothetical protein
MNLVVALLVQAAAFWSVVAFVPAGLVTPTAWVGLHAVSVAAFIASRFANRPAWRARRWFALVFYSLMFAGMFYGLNIGQDILRGADRPKAEVAKHLGGVEIWFFLCPGVATFALAGATNALASSRRRHASS